MIRFLMSFLAIMAVPVAAQTSSAETVSREKCDNVVVSRAQAEDVAQLVADAECFARRISSAAISQSYRLEKAKELSDAASEPHSHMPPVSGGYLPAAVPDKTFGFDEKLGLKVAWGNGRVPGTYSENEGAFRFTCGGNLPVGFDDYVVYPGQPGASHLHQPWGSHEFDAFTTAKTLAAEPQTNCNDTPYSLNRSGYWQPALIHDSGEAVQPDLISVYYKRVRSVSPQCKPGSDRYMGECVGLPNDIRFIFGWDMNNPTAPVQGASWYCTGGSGKHFDNLDDVFASGCGAGDTLVANTIAPQCWDGEHIDSPDHRSHMAWTSYGDWGYSKCPSTHPYVIPQQENKAMWTVTADMIDAAGRSRIRLSSDDMVAGFKPGQTLHADYAEKWDARAKAMWTEHCIEKGLSCSGGDLGNGLQLIGAAEPTYGWKNPKPRVPVPAR